MIARWEAVASAWARMAGKAAAMRSCAKSEVTSACPPERAGKKLKVKLNRSVGGIRNGMHAILTCMSLKVCMLWASVSSIICRMRAPVHSSKRRVMNP